VFVPSLMLNLVHYIFCLLSLLPPVFTLFPYTTLFRSSAAELMAAAAQARAGDTIALAAGTYDTVTLRNVKFDAPVTITSATPGKDRKSTRLNSSHVEISYAVFCLKKKKYKLHADQRGI